MRIWGRRVVVLVTGAAVGLSTACGGAAPPPAPPTSGLDQAGFDRAVRPADDLFDFVNGTWMRNTQIPPDMSEYGSFSILAEKSRANQRTLIDEAAKDTNAPANSDQRKIGDMYASFMDTGRLDQLRAAPLAPDFAAVDKISNSTDLVRHLGEIQRFGASNPIGLSVSQDSKQATSYVTDVFQGGTSLPDRDYYLSNDKKFTDIRDKYRAYTAKMLTLAGLPDPDGTAGRVLDLETKLAAAEWTKVQNRDPLAIYNRFTVADATKATGMDWATYMAGAGVTQPDFIISQPSFFSALSKMVTEVPLDTWKQYLKWHLLQDYGSYLSQDFVDTKFDFGGKVLGGREQNRDRWQRGVAAVNGVLGETLGRMYVSKYFAPEAKERAEALVRNLLDAYRRSIDTLDWMTPQTKAAARAKLDKLAVKIGYPNQWKDYSKLEIKRDDLIGNLQRAARFEHQRALDKLGKPVDRNEWFMTPQTVNAYYSPTMNEIAFPAAILQPPFFDARADDAVNYGAIGAVIGHEISHAFDDQGRQYDGDGNLRDWWTPEDAQRFTAKTKALVAQYNAYQPLPDAHVNGELTLGENIADLSGLTVAHRAYQASLAGKPSSVIDGFTGDQRFFLGFGQIWRTKEREESLRTGLLTDPHSPGLFRSNGVVTNVDAFYQAFDLKPTDKLFKPPADRIHIW
ncbi:M13 family metallopeptidase [Pseudonocardia acaciae]|uniref:M13 family metallopeptidase n=1 Tax=Pseudonocardia acaciae TaxID=551276 RepID=UPI00048EEA97|nr:M13-type metalloendopeptidase [Pseudonocardia acaciae]